MKLTLSPDAADCTLEQMCLHIVNGPNPRNDPPAQLWSAALTFCLLFLRGGRAADEQLTADRADWEIVRGAPTESTVLEWARSREVDARIVAPLVRGRMRRAQ